ncbi:hypothetical protein [Phenylobacterium sp.]|jgi:hypothetical protein|uniref:hypothetical protein n=1 Tax=Phenylobacterium sp. TaxID=1871053 RepID=UPI002F92A34F
MYRLNVFHDGRTTPTQTVALSQAGDVLTSIPMLLEQFPDCARVEVTAGAVRLFSVDCKGNRIPS